MESTELIPLAADIAKTTRRAEEFKDLHQSLQRNLQTYLTLTMDALAGVHQRAKNASMADTTRQIVSCKQLLNYSFTDDVGLGWTDFVEREEKVAVADGVCWYPEISHVARRVFVPCQAGCRDCFVACMLYDSDVDKSYFILSFF
jgi:hypothetical protein